MKRFTIREHVSLAREYRSNFRNMEVFLTLSHDEIAARQLTQIQSIIRHAYERSDFYRKLYMSHGIDPADIRTWEDYQQLPTVTKDEIIAGRDRIPATNRLKAGVLRTSHTSGSSGRNLEILADSERWIISALMTLRMYRSSFRFNSGDKAALIYTSPF